jgi:hypothetical protein
LPRNNPPEPPAPPEDPAWAEISRELIIIKDTVPFWSGSLERNAIRNLNSAIKYRTNAVSVLVEKLEKAIEANKDNYDQIQVARDALAKMKIAANRIGGPALTGPDGYAVAPGSAFDDYIVKGAKELQDFFNKYNIEDDPKGEYWSEPHFNIAKSHLLDDKKVQRLMSHYNKKGDAKGMLITHPDFQKGAFDLYKHVSDQIRKASVELSKLHSRI